MKKLSFVLLFVVITANGFSQKKFEPGYFIGNDDKKVECLIGVEKFRSNPTEFKYKTDANSEKMTADIKTVKEFGIPGSNIRFIRAKVNLDYSSDLTTKQSDQRAPEWREEEVFLSVVVDGKAKLYSWASVDKTRFLYSLDGSPIEQLVYKKYTTQRKADNPNATYPSQSKYATFENLEYVGQLINKVNCGSKTQDDIAKVKYNLRDMKAYFEGFNKCSGS